MACRVGTWGGGPEGHGVVSVCRCACRLHFGLGSHGRVNSEIIQVVPTYLETAAAQRETCSKGCTPHEWVDPRLPRLRIILLGKYLVLGTGGHQVGRLTVPIRERVNELSRSLFFQHQIGQLHRFRTEAAGLRSEFRQDKSWHRLHLFTPLTVVRAAVRQTVGLEHLYARQREYHLSMQFLFLDFRSLTAPPAVRR